MHWTQTPEGRERMAEIQRTRMKAKKQKKVKAKKKRAYAKRAVTKETNDKHDIIIYLRKAEAELDKGKVTRKLRAMILLALDSADGNG